MQSSRNLSTREQLYEARRIYRERYVCMTEIGEKLVSASPDSYPLVTMTTKPSLYLQHSAFTQNCWFGNSCYTSDFASAAKCVIVLS